MKKEILFLLLDKWSDWEAAYLSVGIQMLAGESYCVKTVAIDKKEVISIGGFKTVCDYNLSTIPEEYEALILIGGLSWRKDSYDEIKKIINQSLEKKKIVGAICDAAGFLGTIGVLNNIKHTCNDLHDLKSWAGDKYLGEDKFIPKRPRVVFFVLLHQLAFLVNKIKGYQSLVSLFYLRNSQTSYDNIDYQTLF